MSAEIKDLIITKTIEQHAIEEKRKSLNEQVKALSEEQQKTQIAYAECGAAIAVLIKSLKNTPPE